LNDDGIYRSIMASQLGAHYTLIPNEVSATFIARSWPTPLKSPPKADRTTSRGKRVACFRQKKDHLRTLAAAGGEWGREAAQDQEGRSSRNRFVLEVNARPVTAVNRSSSRSQKQML
jgi:hypothetical protein